MVAGHCRAAAAAEISAHGTRASTSTRVHARVHVAVTFVIFRSVSDISAIVAAPVVAAEVQAIASVAATIFYAATIREAVVSFRIPATVMV